jgi:cytochrome P450
MKILSFQKLFSFWCGPMCIGNNFAMYEMILAIIALVEQFK